MAVPPEVELHHFKGVVRSLMRDASEVLAELELEVSGAEVERLTELLDHYISYTQHFCDEGPNTI